MKNWKTHHHLLFWGGAAVVAYLVYNKYEKSQKDMTSDAKVTPPAAAGSKTNFTGNYNVRP